MPPGHDHPSDTPERGGLAIAESTVRRLDLLQTVAALLSSIGVVYFIGAIVVALRLSGSDLPVEEGLKATQRDVLVLVGFRECVLIGFVALLYALMLRGARPRRLLLAVSAALLLLVPLTLAGLLWPLGTAALAFMAPRSSDAWRVGGQLRAIVVAAVLVGVAVPLRHTDPPYRFSVVHLWTTTNCGSHHELLVGRSSAACLGAFVSATGDGLYVGAPTTVLGERRIVFFPTGTVVEMELTAHAPAAPRTSVVGYATRLFDDSGRSALACNPLECWIGTDNYGARFFG